MIFFNQIKRVAKFLDFIIMKKVKDKLDTIKIK